MKEVIVPPAGVLPHSPTCLCGNSQTSPAGNWLSSDLGILFFFGLCRSTHTRPRNTQPSDIRPAGGAGGPAAQWPRLVAVRQIFRQHAALNSGTQWHEINSSFHALAILSYRVGLSQVCSICHEPDHTPDLCAMLVLQPHHLPPAAQQLTLSTLWTGRFGGWANEKASQAWNTGVNMHVMEQREVHVPVLQLQAYMCYMQKKRTQRLQQTHPINCSQQRHQRPVVGGMHPTQGSSDRRAETGPRPDLG